MTWHVRSSTITLLLVAASAAMAMTGCEPDDSYSCSGTPLTEQAQEALRAYPPAWYPSEWDGRAGYLSAPGKSGETCVDDARAARALAETRNEESTLAPSPLTSERETEKFFELTRADQAVVFRVHRCAYLDRSARDPRDRSDEVELGTLNVRPITPEVAAEAALYVWTFEHFDNNVTVLSEPTAIDGALGRSFEVAFVTLGDLPTEVEVRHVRIEVDPATGRMRRVVGPVEKHETEICSGNRRTSG